MAQAQICRIEKSSNYTTMGNFHLRDKKLSLKAKGLLSVVLSLPPNWDYSVAGLVAIVMEKETVVRSCLKELKEAGYLVVEKERPTKENGGHFNYVYIFYEKSQLLDHEIENSICENLDVETLDIESLDVEVLDVENQGQINTNILSKDKLSKEELKTKYLDVETKCGNSETKCQNVVSKCENVETKCENVVSPRMNKLNNKYKGISKKELYTVDSKKRKIFRKPSIEEVQAYCEERGNSVDPESFVDFYESKGWVVGKSPMKDWKAAVRTWERNGYGNQNKVESARKDVLYKPRENDDITYKRMFEKWKQYLGTSLKETDQEVAACRELLDDLGEEWVEKLIVALRMRGETNYVMREIKAIQDFVGLANNRSMMMSFYNEHRKEWELKIREAQTGKKPWEL